MRLYHGIIYLLYTAEHEGCNFFYMKIKIPATNILSAYCAVVGGALLTIKESHLASE